MVAGAAVTLVLAAAALFGWAAVEARRGLAPAGPGCDYEIDVGSGPVGSGVEQVESTPLPERRCLATTGPGVGRSWPRAGLDSSEVEDLVRWATVVGLAPLAVGGATGWWIARRPRPGRRRSSGVAPA